MLLVVPVDMPLLGAPTLEKLLAGTDAEPRHYADHPLPLRLALTPNAVASIAARAAPDARDRSLAGLLRELGATALPPPADLGEFANLNHPDDWAQMRPARPPLSGAGGQNQARTPITHCRSSLRSPSRRAKSALSPNLRQPTRPT